MLRRDVESYNRRTRCTRCSDRWTLPTQVENYGGEQADEAAFRPESAKERDESGFGFLIAHAEAANAALIIGRSGR
jgi:hypothetical protein